MRRGDAPSEASGRGRVVNVSSDAGKPGFPLLGAYCASKFAVLGLTQAVAEEAAPGVRVERRLPRDHRRDPAWAASGDRRGGWNSATANSRGGVVERRRRPPSRCRARRHHSRCGRRGHVPDLGELEAGSPGSRSTSTAASLAGSSFVSTTIPAFAVVVPHPSTVIPAKAGIRPHARISPLALDPALAGDDGVESEAYPGGARGASHPPRSSRASYLAPLASKAPRLQAAVELPLRRQQRIFPCPSRPCRPLPSAVAGGGTRARFRSRVWQSRRRR